MAPLDAVLPDLRYAVRSLRRSPVFTTVVLVTLVSGIAAVTTIFSYLNAVYFADLPYRDAKQTVSVGERTGYAGYVSSAAAVRLLREPTASFERVAVYESSVPTVVFGSEPRQVGTLGVDTGFFPLFGLRPAAGRMIAPDEIRAEAPVAMISRTMWEGQFGADTAAVGAMLQLGERRYQIVGVLPDGFRFPYQTDAIIPFAESRLRDNTSAEHDYYVLGRLRAGVTREQARGEMRVLGDRLPPDRSRRVLSRLVVLDEMLDRRGRQFLPLPGLFLGAGLFVLLIACANVANLFLARGAERRGEVAIRASLGASRQRLLRQALTETLLLAGVAAAAGTLMSSWLLRLGLSFIPTQGFPSWFRVTTDYRVLFFATGVLLLVTLAVGVSPALEGTRIDLAGALKGSGESSGATRRVMRSSSRGLTIQLSFAVALFVSAALLVRSYQRLSRIDFGYPAEQIAVVHPFFDRARYRDPEPRVELLENVARDLSAVPGIRQVAVRGFFNELKVAAVMTAQDSARRRVYDSRLVPDGDTLRAVRAWRPPNQLAVGDDYFAMLELRIREGRGFLPSDVPSSTPVAVISVSAAKALWPGASALGRTIQFGAYGDRFTVVGVVDDVHDLYGGRAGISNTPVPTLYGTTRQARTHTPELLARSSGEVSALRRLMADRIRSADPSLVLGREETLASQQGEAFLVTRVFGGLIGVFAVVAFALSVIGIYGVVAFGVARRTREIGIRIALGGTSTQVQRHVMLGAAGFIVAGLVIGLALAVAMGRLLKVFLFGVSALDPIAYASVCVLFAAVAVFASWLPARKAASVDPLVALRAE